MRSKKFIKEQLATLDLEVHEGLVPSVKCKICGFQLERIGQYEFSTTGHNMLYDEQYNKYGNPAYNQYGEQPRCIEIIAMATRDYGTPRYSLASRSWFCSGFV